jgi:hypothetical protein
MTLLEGGMFRLPAWTFRFVQGRRKYNANLVEKYISENEC